MGVGKTVIVRSVLLQSVSETVATHDALALCEQGAPPSGSPNRHGCAFALCEQEAPQATLRSSGRHCVQSEVDHSLVDVGCRSSRGEKISGVKGWIHCSKIMPL
jgi:hypothetical protein